MLNRYSSIKQAIQQQLSVDSANARFNLAENNTSITGYQGGSSKTISHLTSVQMRSDLIESQIYLCNSHVLSMFTDSNSIKPSIFLLLLNFNIIYYVD